MARMVEGRVVHSFQVGKPERKSPLGRPRGRWEDNVKMDLKEVEGVTDWMELAQDKDCKYIEYIELTAVSLQIYLLYHATILRLQIF